MAAQRKAMLLYRKLIASVPALIITCALWIAATGASATIEFQPRPLVFSDHNGFCFARTYIVADNDGIKGVTETYVPGQYGDIPIDHYALFSKNLHVNCKPPVGAFIPLKNLEEVVRKPGTAPIPDWERYAEQVIENRPDIHIVHLPHAPGEPHPDRVAISFYRAGVLLRSYSTLEIATDEKHPCENIVGYANVINYGFGGAEVFSLSSAEWDYMTGFLAFVVTTVDGRKMTFNTNTGELVKTEQVAPDPNFSANQCPDTEKNSPTDE